MKDKKREKLKSNKKRNISSASTPEHKKSKTDSTQSIPTASSDESLSSGSESESEEDYSMQTLRKDQARDMKSLRKLIKTIAYKQNETIEKLDDLDKRVSKLTITMAEQGKALALLQSDVNEVKREQSKSTKIQDTITASLNRQNETIDTMKEHINKLEEKSRERNLRVVNYNEEEGEKVTKIVADVLRTKFSIDASKIEVAHRTGKTKFVNGQDF